MGAAGAPLADYLGGALPQSILGAAGARILLFKPNDGIEKLLKKDELFIADCCIGIDAAFITALLLLNASARAWNNCSGAAALSNWMDDSFIWPELLSFCFTTPTKAVCSHRTLN